MQHHPFDAKAESGSSAPAPPFALVSRAGDIDGSQIGELHRNAAEDTPTAAVSPVGTMPLLVISARGRSVSGGAVIANVAKGAFNVLFSIAARQAGGVDFDKDTVDLTLKLFDPVSGQLLWQAGKRVAEDPDAENFDVELKEMLREFPRAKS